MQMKQLVLSLAETKSGKLVCSQYVKCAVIGSRLMTVNFILRKRWREETVLRILEVLKQIRLTSQNDLSHIPERLVSEQHENSW